MTILAHDVGLKRSAIADGRHVAHVDHGAVYLLDGQHGKFVDRAWRGVGAHVILASPDLCRTGWHHHVLRGHRGEQVARRDAFGLHLCLVHVDGDLRLLAPVGLRQNGTRHGDQRRTHGVRRQVGKLLFVQAVAADAKLQNRHAGSRKVDDLRRQNTGWQLANKVLRSRGDLRVCRIQAGAGLQKDLDHRNTVVAGRFGVLHVVNQRRQRLLVRRRQPAFDLFCVQTRVLPRNCHDRDVDVREDVRRCAQNHDGTQQQNQQRQHDERVRPVQRNLDDPHRASSARPYPSEKPLVSLDRRKCREERSLFRRVQSVLPMALCARLAPVELRHLTYFVTIASTGRLRQSCPDAARVAVRDQRTDARPGAGSRRGADRSQPAADPADSAGRSVSLGRKDDAAGSRAGRAISATIDARRDRAPDHRIFRWWQRQLLSQGHPRLPGPSQECSRLTGGDDSGPPGGCAPAGRHRHRIYTAAAGAPAGPTEQQARVQ